MSLIGVLSDTHDHLRAVRAAVDHFNSVGVELVIHAGDYVAPFTLRELLKLKSQLVGVFGNCDGDRIKLSQTHPRIQDDPLILEHSGYKILVTHRPELAQALRGSFDLIVFGHTHQPLTQLPLLNPGECCGYLTGKSTIALIDLEANRAQLIQLQI